VEGDVRASGCNMRLDVALHNLAKVKLGHSLHSQSPCKSVDSCFYGCISIMTMQDCEHML
jgi:hypothetical protein